MELILDNLMLEVTRNCNLSYQSQKKWKVGNVNEIPLDQILINCLDEEKFRIAKKDREFTESLQL